MEFSTSRASKGLSEAIWKLDTCGVEESSRNGLVVTVPEPVIYTLTNPMNRIIACPYRNANPFFHVMETIWMFAGSKDVKWITQFNSRYPEYANDSVVHGAYGYRWLGLWGDQISRVVQQLKDDPTTRQAVLAMWDPNTDWMPHWKDRPCNTHVYFRIIEDELHMTVCNRSNDVVWGMFGANIVHMTYLQELVACALDVMLGSYRVVTNNMHFYPDLYPNAAEIWNASRVEYLNPACDHPIMSPMAEELGQFLNDCHLFVNGVTDVGSPWLSDVAYPMRQAYLDKENSEAWAALICDDGWRVACKEWLKRNRRGSE